MLWGLCVISVKDEDIKLFYDRHVENKKSYKYSEIWEYLILYKNNYNFIGTVIIVINIFLIKTNILSNVFIIFVYIY